MQEKIESLKTENQKLKEALEFYADYDNWILGGLDASETTISGDRDESICGGKRARQALKEIK